MSQDAASILTTAQYELYLNAKMQLDKILKLPAGEQELIFNLLFSRLNTIFEARQEPSFERVE